MSKNIQSHEQVSKTSIDLTKLIGPALKGDTKALEKFRAFLATVKGTVPAGVWKAYQDELCALFGGDPARSAVGGMLDFHCGADLIRREMVERTLAALRAELAGKHSTPLERVMVERIVACWLDVWITDDYYYKMMSQQNRPIPTADFLQRARDRAHRRLIAATKALATVREIVLPNLPREEQPRTHRSAGELRNGRARTRSDVDAGVRSVVNRLAPIQEGRRLNRSTSRRPGVPDEPAILRN